MDRNINNYNIIIENLSRTPQGCGDRNTPHVGSISLVTPVAPRRGAWIEIITILDFENINISRTPQGCVDRNFSTVSSMPVGACRTPQGCVDRNHKVDRNARNEFESHPAGVRG